MIDPELDGITHINVYSKGGTWLGKKLSNFAYSQISTEDGKFDSIEAYWYWLLSDNEGRDKIRNLSGYAAKKFGQSIAAHDYHDKKNIDFKLKILKAIYTKIVNDDRLKSELAKSELPFTHYYVYSDTIIEPMDSDWILRGIENIRKWLKKGLIS